MMEKTVIHLVYYYISLWIILGSIKSEDMYVDSASGRSNAALQHHHHHQGNSEAAAKKSVVCYQCNSAYDPNCGDPFESYTIGVVNCSLKPKPEHLGPNVTSTICRKTIQIIYGKTRVVRDCGYLTDPPHDDKQCYLRTGTHEVQVTYCSCTTSECNHSPLHPPTIITSAMLLTLLLIL